MMRMAGGWREEERRTRRWERRREEWKGGVEKTILPREVVIEYIYKRLTCPSPRPLSPQALPGQRKYSECLKYTSRSGE